MPSEATYPGVYSEEIASGVRTITGVPTSITAFIGRALRGPANEPAAINSFADFTRLFGGLDFNFPMGYAVQDFFANGGSQAIIVRLEKKSARAKNKIIRLEAASPGAWGNALVYAVDSKNITAAVAARFGIAKTDLFNLTIFEIGAGGQVIMVERFLNVAVTAAAGSRRLDQVLADGSHLVRVPLKKNGTSNLPGKRPVDSAPGESPSDPLPNPVRFKKFSGGADGVPLTAENDFLGDETKQTGMYALAKADLFNLLCLPPDTRNGDTPATVYQKALAYCVKRRALLIVDPPVAWGAHKTAAVANAIAGLGALGLNGNAARNAALYFPRVVEADPQRGGQPDVFVPCGIVAGVMARTDAQRGVWKAPAGLNASLVGTQDLQVNLTDADNGILNPVAINCLRFFPAAGRVIWGARTLRGADQLADEWKPVPVRRTALFIEESLYRGTQWAVFEPNDEPLWAQIRLHVGTFLHELFRQGAFQGASPKNAYFVKCDQTTTTPEDVQRGLVNLVVGFAPLKPAEFVVIYLQQQAGQT